MKAGGVSTLVDNKQVDVVGRGDFLFLS